MIRQKSFETDVSTLYLVPTPIGNLQEMTPRALDILKEVSVIAAEDTRNTKKLLMAYGIDTILMSHHEHNQQVSIPKIIERLENGENVAVVSDAGYPLVSDPGQKLVQETISHGFNVSKKDGRSLSMSETRPFSMPDRSFDLMMTGLMKWSPSARPHPCVWRNSSMNSSKRPASASS